MTAAAAADDDDDAHSVIRRQMTCHKASRIVGGNYYCVAAKLY